VKEIVVVKDYNNAILEFKTISMWIIYKYIRGTFESPTFA